MLKEVLMFSGLSKKQYIHIYYNGVAQTCNQKADGLTTLLDHIYIYTLFYSSFPTAGCGWVGVGWGY